VTRHVVCRRRALRKHRDSNLLGPRVHNQRLYSVAGRQLCLSRGAEEEGEGDDFLKIRGAQSDCKGRETDARWLNHLKGQGRYVSGIRSQASQRGKNIRKQASQSGKKRSMPGSRGRSEEEEEEEELDCPPRPVEEALFDKYDLLFPNWYNSHDSTVFTFLTQDSSLVQIHEVTVAGGLSQVTAHIQRRKTQTDRRTDRTTIHLA